MNAFKVTYYVISGDSNMSVIRSGWQFKQKEKFFGSVDSAQAFIEKKNSAMLEVGETPLTDYFATLSGVELE